MRTADHTIISLIVAVQFLGSLFWLLSIPWKFNYELTWTISDSSGRELPRKPFLGFACPVGGPTWNKGLVRRMKDSDLTILQAGGKLEFVIDDIWGDYIFRLPGSYQVTVTYTYLPPRIEGSDGATKDRFGQEYNLTDVSSQTVEMLKDTQTLVATRSSILVIE